MWRAADEMERGGLGLCRGFSKSGNALACPAVESWRRDRHPNVFSRRSSGCSACDVRVDCTCRLVGRFVAGVSWRSEGVPGEAATLGSSVEASCCVASRLRSKRGKRSEAVAVGGFRSGPFIARLVRPTVRRRLGAFGEHGKRLRPAGRDFALVGRTAPAAFVFLCWESTEERVGASDGVTTPGWSRPRPRLSAKASVGRHVGRSGLFSRKKPPAGFRAWSFGAARELGRSVAYFSGSSSLGDRGSFA